MGFFAPTPQVTGDEWRKARLRLLSRGLSYDDVDAVEDAMKRFGRGVDRNEIRKIIGYLRNHPGRHELTEEQIKKVEDVLQDHL